MLDKKTITRFQAAAKKQNRPLYIVATYAGLRGSASPAPFGQAHYKFTPTDDIVYVSWNDNAKSEIPVCLCDGELVCS